MMGVAAAPLSMTSPVTTRTFCPPVQLCGTSAVISPAATSTLTVTTGSPCTSPSASISWAPISVKTAGNFCQSRPVAAASGFAAVDEPHPTPARVASNDNVTAARLSFMGPACPSCLLPGVMTFEWSSFMSLVQGTRRATPSDIPTCTAPV